MRVLYGLVLLAANAVQNCAAGDAPPAPRIPPAPEIPPAVITSISVEQSATGTQLVHAAGEHFTFEGERYSFHCCFDIDESKCDEESPKTEATVTSDGKEMTCKISVKEEKKHDLFMSIWQTDQFHEQANVKFDCFNMLRCESMMCEVVDPHSLKKDKGVDTNTVMAVFIVIAFMVLAGGFVYMVHLGKNDPDRTSRLSRFYWGLKRAHNVGLLDDFEAQQGEPMNDYDAPTTGV